MNNHHNFDAAQLNASRYIGRYPPKNRGKTQVLNTTWFLTTKAKSSFAGNAVAYKNPATSAGGDVQTNTIHAERVRARLPAATNENTVANGSIIRTAGAAIAALSAVTVPKMKEVNRSIKASTKSHDICFSPATL